MWTLRDSSAKFTLFQWETSLNQLGELEFLVKQSSGHPPKTVSNNCWLLYGWLHERARLNESRVLIGYPSRQDRPILPARDCPLGIARFVPAIDYLGVIIWPYNKPFVDQACSVKMAKYWPRSFFALLWTETKSRSIKTTKKILTNIQPSWPHAWLITHIYCS